ncbi:NACHT domain-containing protein [Geitlerinema calcuttense]|uniref:NACHT domain-containing protein n=1 Tax=Geitlerinema calcuttense NRMC-F 0142 TaxID=2922238 RepID=A0ABT7M0A0_9CYAN|nr:NACHT domain-containing protein [Geitlerinema calcuttense]MDL5057671.1 NACHT domain-containing protein [Geitlerinema calcuttense NRMC-F 0142]
MDVARSLVKLTVASGCVLGGLVFPPLRAAEGIVWGTVLATALSSIAAGNTANAIDALVDGTGSGGVSLDNEDLTEAVGKAIAAVITLAAKQHPGDTHRKLLEKIAAQAKDNWVKIAQQELTKERYPQLGEAKLDEFLTPEEYRLTQDGNLTPQEWQDIFIRLNMATCEGGGFQLPPQVYPQVADLLHITFPKALRETLKEDFAKDGKAFVGLTLQLLTGMKGEIEQLRNTNLGINTGELSQIIERFQHLETQLQGTATQQEAVFSQISQEINSGFLEMCQRLGVLETTITQLLQGLEESVKDIQQKVSDIHNRLKPKSLTVEDWKEICSQNLTQQKQLTTNPFTNTYGVTPQLDDIYVRLAIVERKLPKPSSRNQPEEKEEEKLIPIAEEHFFEDVLRQGKSQISQGRRIAIIGEPGSGKTTRLQKIAYEILDKGLGLPIWISLTDLTQPTITQYIEKIWLKQTGKSLTIDELTQHKERIWLLLDGLDEMTSRVETHHVTTLLGGWVQAVRVVVTCRVNVWEADKNAFSGFDVFRNLEFNPEQVTDYIRRWFAEMGDAATGESLEAALAQSENSRLKELIQNPLRLWMLCRIWQTGGGLPETQAGLYRKFVDWMYRWTADEKILDQRKAIDAALARLALAAMKQKDKVSRLRLQESWVLEVLRSRPIFQAMTKLGGLYRVEGFPEAICVFYHATFQEYFAALAVDDWDNFLPRNHVDFPVEGKEYRIFEPQWKQVVLFWLGRSDVADEEKERFIDKLVNFDDGCGEFYKYRAYFLAAAGIAELDKFDARQHNNEIINQLIRWWFDFPKIEDRKWLMYSNYIEKSAVKALKETNRLQAIHALTDLLKMLQHKSEKDCFRVAAFILDIDSKNTESKTVLINLLSNESYRQAAISILSAKNIDHPEVKRSVEKQKISLASANQILGKQLQSQINRRWNKERSLHQEKRLQAIKNLTECNDVNYLICQLRNGFEIQTRGGTHMKHTFVAAHTRLAQIGVGKISVLRAILHLLFTKPSHFLCNQTINLCQQIITDDSMYISVIKILKDYLKGEVIDFNSDAYKCSGEIFFYCADKLPYPQFYQAWHQDNFN